MLLIALWIKRDSPGPVLFCQERVGWRGRRFRMFKFRTMVSDAESRMPGLMNRNEAAGPYFKIRRDPRITRAGAFLRRWSLDELPQLLNVLRGEMSLVGPRPLLPQAGRFGGWHGRRLEVRPGMTGLWQIRGRSDLPLDQAVALDLSYIDRWSPGLDLRILTETLPAVLRGRGAY